MTAVAVTVNAVHTGNLLSRLAGVVMEVAGEALTARHGSTNGVGVRAGVGAGAGAGAGVAATESGGPAGAPRTYGSRSKTTPRLSLTPRK